MERPLRRCGDGTRRRRERWSTPPGQSRDRSIEPCGGRAHAVFRSPRLPSTHPQLSAMDAHVESRLLGGRLPTPTSRGPSYAPVPKGIPAVDDIRETTSPIDSGRRSDMSYAAACGAPGRPRLLRVTSPATAHPAPSLGPGHTVLGSCRRNNRAHGPALRVDAKRRGKGEGKEGDSSSEEAEERNALLAALNWIKQKGADVSGKTSHLQCRAPALFPWDADRGRIAARIIRSRDLETLPQPFGLGRARRRNRNPKTIRPKRTEKRLPETTKRRPKAQMARKRA